MKLLIEKYFYHRNKNKINFKMGNFKFLVFLFTILLSTSSIGQNTNSNEKRDLKNDTTIELNVDFKVEKTELAAFQTNWFTGTNQEIENKINNTTSVLISKKEMYLVSGLSNKTLLIRSLLKKADSNVNATA